MTSTPDRSSFSAAILGFIRLESSGGAMILLATTLAMVAANTPLSALYGLLLDVPLVVTVGGVGIDKPLLLWINDGLMAIFFFLIGLEVKREALEGELASPERIALPAVGALGGILAPACVYAAFNWRVPGAMDGWAIPVATDIAFALALLGAFGARVPVALKAFLLALAIFDDLAAIAIIAVFYAKDLSPVMLATAAVALVAAAALNRRRVTTVAPYVLVGLVLWTAMLKSGVHATLAGVLVALCIPMRAADGRSPVEEMERDLHAPVALAVLPVFAFANAGVSFAGIGIADLADPVTLGIAFGLFLGNPVGILGLVFIASKLRWVSLPEGVTWGQLTGTAFACGIGFTMSLFIASLAFEHADGSFWAADKLGILLGSAASAVVGFAVLSFALPRSPDDGPR
ncbi:MAG: Na+/H+ antiporter NhaA [Gammaproteobacteria bacterium]|nr:Na+/H+ antiporter NhaA [Gammaproteobacteria bacterium]MYJ25600.1 Na+/H+ antiporter NhaA [Holophagales bacterium]